MNTIIEEIRKRIKAESGNTDEAGDYDEYADGQRVGLAAALRIIDEVEKEYPVSEDVQKTAHKVYPVDMLGDVHHPKLLIDRNQTKRESFIEGMLAERERLMKEAVECNVIWYDGRLLDFTQEQLDNALDKIGAGVDAKVSVILSKKGE